MLGSYTIPNLIQGVSQQSPEQRRATQCEAQQNCINSSKEGAVARPGAEFLALIDSCTDAAFHEIFRGTTEHYLVIIPNVATGVGGIRIYDLVNFVSCTLTLDGSQANYLGMDFGGKAKDNFRFQTVDDYTFIANTTKIVALTADVKSTRPHEALIFIKAGAYSQEYAVVIHINGLAYRWAYTTPDNSVAANAAYITTSQIAATLARAMNGFACVPYVHGVADDATRPGAGPNDVGDDGTHGTVVGAATTATSLGFALRIRGNVILVTGPASPDFTIDCADGVGNTFMSTLKTKIRTLAELPQKAMLGVRFRVSGVENKSDKDYYIEYTADDTWQECLGAGVKTTLDKTTMPHALINTGPLAFTFQAVDWDIRVAGDDDSAKVPYFVGKAIQDIFFFVTRLGILTEGAYDLSKSRNAFSFFPDTVQTILGTAPISNPLQGGKSISLARRAVIVGESLYLWAQDAQHRVSSGSQPLRQDTSETKISTAYPFAENAPPVAVAASLYFAMEMDNWALLKMLAYNPYNSLVAPVALPVDLTAHVPAYIKTGVRHILCSYPLGMFSIQSDGLLFGVYHYDFIEQGSELIQSAWQTWTLPAGTVLWSGIYKSKLYLAQQRADGVVLTTINLTTTIKDPSETYLTRLDYRIAESGVANLTYDAVLDQTTMDLPYGIADADEQAQAVLVIRTDSANFVRGKVFTLQNTAADPVWKVRVSGDVYAEKFYVGFLIESFLEFSQFFPREPQGAAVMYDEVIVKRALISHAHTSYYKATITDDTGSAKDVEWTSQLAGVGGAATGHLEPTSGVLDLPIERRSDKYTLRLTNKSPFPSAWQRVRVTFSAINRGASDRGM